MSLYVWNARIAREGNKPTRGRVVAGLSFGFWRALFDKKYHRLWVSHLHRAFPAGTVRRFSFRNRNWGVFLVPERVASADLFDLA